MAKGATWRLNRREFDKTLAMYRPYTKRDLPTICNTKGYFIQRRATVDILKSTKAQIREDLMEEGRLPAPIAALIVNAKRKADGLPGLFGKGMRTAVNALIKARKVASLAAGWIPGIKALEPYAEKRGAPRQARVQVTGRPRGSGTPAKEGWRCVARFVNEMQAKWDTREGAAAVATPALQAAFDAEEASMKAYIERKLKESAQRAGIKTG